MHDLGAEALRLLERHVVRRVLEPDESPGRGVERVEVGRREPRVGVAIVATQEERDGHAHSGDGPPQVEGPELLVHRLERDLVGPDEVRDLPGSRVPGERAAQDGPGEARPLVEDPAVAIRQLLEGELVARVVRRRADLAQRPGRVVVASAFGLGLHERALGLLGRERRGHLRDADRRGHLPGMGVGVQEPERGSPRVAHEDDPVPREARPQVVHDRVEIGQVARDRELTGVRLRIEGPPGAALVPVHHDEVPLQLAVEEAEERRLGAARSAVQPEQHGRASIGPADHEVERCTVHGQTLAAIDRDRRRGRQARPGAAGDGRSDQEPSGGERRRQGPERPPTASRALASCASRHPRRTVARSARGGCASPGSNGGRRSPSSPRCRIRGRPNVIRSDRDATGAARRVGLRVVARSGP